MNLYQNYLVSQSMLRSKISQLEYALRKSREECAQANERVRCLESHIEDLRVLYPCQFRIGNYRGAKKLAEAKRQLARRASSVFGV